MSLFENDEYRWRETYFLLMEAKRRPSGDTIRRALCDLNERYELSETRVDDEGCFESLTLYSPDDNAAMDVTYVDGEEVVQQTMELIDEMKRTASSGKESAAVRRLSNRDARLDVYHFEKLTFIGGDNDDDEEEFLDPGSLLIVLDKLAELCDGIAIDPQTGSILP